jgi:hypothetical protein
VVSVTEPYGRILGFLDRSVKTRRIQRMFIQPKAVDQERRKRFIRTLSHRKSLIYFNTEF